MKKLRIVSGLLIVVMVLSMITINVFAVEKNNNKSSYNYGVEPYSEEWYKLSTKEKKEIFVLPKEEAQNMTTFSLLESILDNPYFADVYAYETFLQGLSVKNFRFHFDELFSRDDFVEVVNEYIKNKNIILTFDEKGNIKDTRFLTVIEELKNDNFENLEYFLEYTKVLNAYYLRQVYLNSVYSEYDIIYALDSDQIYTLVTPKGYTVEGLKDITWEQWDSADASLGAIYYNQIAAEARDLSLKVQYNVFDTNILHYANPSYNCHSYALYYTSSSNTFWIRNASRYYTDGSYIPSTSVTTGNRILYYNSNASYPYNHSGIVHSIVQSLTGTHILIQSKWGYQGVFVHDVEDCPYAEDSVKSFKKIYNS